MRNPIKNRDVELQLHLIQRPKAGPHKDRKREADKGRCRKRICDREDD